MYRSGLNHELDYFVNCYLSSKLNEDETTLDETINFITKVSKDLETSNERAITVTKRYFALLLNLDRILDMV